MDGDGRWLSIDSVNMREIMYLDDLDLDDLDLETHQYGFG